jgi:hypothetical protein
MEYHSSHLYCSKRMKKTLLQAPSERQDFSGSPLNCQIEGSLMLDGEPSLSRT